MEKRGIELLVGQVGDVSPGSGDSFQPFRGRCTKINGDMIEVADSKGNILSVAPEQFTVADEEAGGQHAQT